MIHLSRAFWRSRTGSLGGGHARRQRARRGSKSGGARTVGELEERAGLVGVHGVDGAARGRVDGEADYVCEVEDLLRRELELGVGAPLES